MNWAQYNASLKARGSLTIWRDKRMTWFANAAIQFCLTLKNLFGLALRQAAGLAESVLQLSGMNWPTPDFSTLFRRRQTLNVQIPHKRSHAGLNLLVNSIPIISPRKNARIRKGSAFAHHNAAIATRKRFAGRYEKLGVGITGEVWWKPR